MSRRLVQIGATMFLPAYPYETLDPRNHAGLRDLKQ